MAQPVHSTDQTWNNLLSLKTDDIIEDAEHFNSCEQQLAWNSTPFNSYSNDIKSMHSQTIKKKGKQGSDDSKPDSPATRHWIKFNYNKA